MPHGSELDRQDWDSESVLRGYVERFIRSHVCILFRFRRKQDKVTGEQHDAHWQWYSIPCSLYSNLCATRKLHIIRIFTTTATTLQRHIPARPHLSVCKNIVYYRPGLYHCRHCGPNNSKSGHTTTIGDKA
eukprot:PhF_6_TR44270/c0_g1_i5/m.68200